MRYPIQTAWLDSSLGEFHSEETVTTFFDLFQTKSCLVYSTWVHGQLQDELLDHVSLMAGELGGHQKMS